MMAAKRTLKEVEEQQFCVDCPQDDLPECRSGCKPFIEKYRKPSVVFWIAVGFVMYYAILFTHINETQLTNETIFSWTMFHSDESISASTKTSQTILSKIGSQTVKTSIKSSINSYNIVMTSIYKVVSSTTSLIAETPKNAYRFSVPEKYKYCNPLKHFDNGTARTPDVCLMINESCCPCQTYGGKVEAINSRFYDEYSKEVNCTDFNVNASCRLASSPAGCKRTAACVNGKCRLVSRN